MPPIPVNHRMTALLYCTIGCNHLNLYVQNEVIYMFFSYQWVGLRVGTIFYARFRPNPTRTGKKGFHCIGARHDQYISRHVRNWSRQYELATHARHRPSGGSASGEYELAESFG